MHDVVERVRAVEAPEHAMIGVIPLPALMNSRLVGPRIREHELALDVAEARRSRRGALAVDVRRDLALSTSFGVIEMKPSGRSGSEVSE